MLNIVTAISPLPVICQYYHCKPNVCVSYVGAFNSFQKKIQSPKMLSALTFILQLNGIMLGFGSNVIALLAGKFEAEFLRVAIKASVAMFTFYADQHWVIRFLVSAKLGSIFNSQLL